MSLRLKTKPTIKAICLLLVGLLSTTLLFWMLLGTVWTWLNFPLLDVFFKQAVKNDHGLPLSPHIVYATLTNESYDAFGKNFLDRMDIAQINDALAHYRPQAVIYDIIFARPSTSDADQRLAESLENLGSVYLPIGVAYANRARPLSWAQGDLSERLRASDLKKPRERGRPEPLYLTRALVQMERFAQAAFNSGHIGIASDPDGIYRHLAMLVKVGSHYVPTLALSVFLDYVEVPFEQVLVDWGRHIIIPATPESWLEREVRIPIDTHGQVFIPYAHLWERDFDKMAVHDLLGYRKKPNLQGNMAEFFEGKFVFVADIATGASDLGQTPLEDRVPLVAVHTSLLNGLLTNTFYDKWSFWQTIGFIGFLSLLLGISALPQSSWFLYIVGSLLLTGTIALSWYEFVNLRLVPTVSIAGSFFFIFFGLVAGLQVVAAKQQYFIRRAFSKYVPEKVVNELLLHPEMLKLGGEERVVSILFADVEDFTAIAESMSPSELVSLLNEYLSEMTAIILAQGGIIDKFEGDAIMAEFGAPLALPDHADRAVRAGLMMLRRLCELRQQWAHRGLPLLHCRVGINTGMAIIGNMGSQQVFDYTVLGDAVNLASRLEGINKLYRTNLMISEFTYNQLSPHLFRVRVVDLVQVKGKSQAVKIFEVYGEATDEVAPQDVWYYEAYGEAFAAYLSRDFVSATDQFARALSIRPDDPASHAIVARMQGLNPHDLPETWDGSITLTTK